jgi:hypothetical protein
MSAAPTEREVLVDRRANDGMHEAQRFVALEDV